jgi:hypothetical protein
MDSVGKVLLCIGLCAIGASTWIICERLKIVSPMCIVDTSLWEQVKQ